MNRRRFLNQVGIASVALSNVETLLADHAAAVEPEVFKDTAQGREWLARWEKAILAEARRRYCDTETGEQLGWLVSPFLNGFHYGHLATKDPKWIELLIASNSGCMSPSRTSSVCPA